MRTFWKKSRFIYVIVLTVLFTALVVGSYNADAVEGLVTVKKDVQTITVGGDDADIPGYTSRAIQIAVDALKSRGEGIVRLNPGQYDITAPVRLYTGVNLVGSGEKTVLHKSDSVSTNFTIDADYGMYKVTVKDASGFKAGMGIQLFDETHMGCWDATTARITSIEGSVLYIDTSLVHDYIGGSTGVITTSGSIVEAVNTENVRMADFTVDGNAANNGGITGCRGGGVYIHRSRNVTVENVKVQNFNGDSFSWQITENITVRKCEASHGTGLGFHPGTGSDSSVIENCISHHNGGDGIFLCWRVQNGIIRNNSVYANGRYGISIGHKDTDNLFERNRVYENGRHGVYFRDENKENAGHRNTFRGNTIENNGSTDFKAYGFYIDGETNDIVIENNTIRSTGKGNQAGAVFVGGKASRVNADDNNVSGHPRIVK
ncbi:right-handed parallel beta-helix repeat-containing protein [Candidatus Omnitrophota bacterium]